MVPISGNIFCLTHSIPDYVENRGRSLRRGFATLSSMESVEEDLFGVQCPCCGGRLEISAELQTVVRHEAAPKGSSPPLLPHDLVEGVRRIEASESGREERFRKRLSAQRQHDKTLEKRFQGLLKQAKDSGPPEHFTRDIDLD